MLVCFCGVCISFSVLSKEIGWEEHPRNDLLCVGWDIKPELNQSIILVWFTEWEMLTEQQQQLGTQLGSNAHGELRGLQRDTSQPCN